MNSYNYLFDTSRAIVFWNNIAMGAKRGCIFLGIQQYKVMNLFHILLVGALDRKCLVHVLYINVAFSSIPEWHLKALSHWGKKN